MAMTSVSVFYKELLSTAAIALTFIAFLPYIRDINRGKVKPHVFSWVIWGSTTFVVFLAQLSDKGGAGAWPIGVSGLVTMYIAVLAYMRRGDISITRMDWIFLVVALSALPLWYVTSDPLWAVVTLTIVDLSGFGPTLRKAYARPLEEQMGLPVIMSVRNLFALLALEHYSVTTMLFPALTGMACLLWVAILVVRRRVIMVSR